MISAEMTIRWKRIFDGTVPDEQIIKATGELLWKYQQPNRHYHTLVHVNSVHEELRRVAGDLDDIDGVALATDVHDAIQEPKVGGDEKNSLKWMQTTLEMFGHDDELFPSLAPCVMATVHAHDGPPDCRDAQYFADADLAILGKDGNEYNRYALQVRKEYSWVPVSLYTAGRSKLLQGFLGRKRLYWTEFFQDSYETTARENIAHEIEWLSR